MGFEHVDAWKHLRCRHGLSLFMALLVAAALGTSPAFAADEGVPVDSETLYAVGLVMARQLSVFNLTPAEFEIVRQGLMDGVTGKTPYETSEAYTGRIMELAKARRDARGVTLTGSAREFIEKAAREKGAVRTPSGLIFLPRGAGKGTVPGKTDTVTVSYRGTLIDGTEFESTYRRGKPAVFVIDSAIRCLSEGVKMMKPGGAARLVCPPDLAYGTAGSGIIPASATLVYDIELVAVSRPEGARR